MWLIKENHSWIRANLLGSINTFLEEHHVADLKPLPWIMSICLGFINTLREEHHVAD